MGVNDVEKNIMVMKVFKLDVYCELVEQVYGQCINGKQLLVNMVINNVQFQVFVEGVICGVKVVKVYLVGDDIYVIELQLDMQQVYNIYLFIVCLQWVKNVCYY